jgi:hypothetical protein
MRIARGLRMTLIKAETVKSRDFVAFCLKDLGCTLYQPESRLLDVFFQYGVIEIYVDGKARGIIERLTEQFILNQQEGLNFKENIKETFSGEDIIVSKHEEGPIVFLASQKNLKLAEQYDLEDVREDEIDRREPWTTTERPALAETEKDMLFDEVKRQAMVAMLLLKKPPEEKG